LGQPRDGLRPIRGGTRESKNPVAESLLAFQPERLLGELRSTRGDEPAVQHAGGQSAETDFVGQGREEFPAVHFHGGGASRGGRTSQGGHEKKRVREPALERRRHAGLTVTFTKRPQMSRF